MKISKLLASRQAVLQQAELVNLAYAYASLRRLADRVKRGRLTGLVNLRQPNEREGRPWPSLMALEGNQSLLEEHFGEEDLIDFADAVAFANGVSGLEITFRLEDIETEFVELLAAALRRSGVRLDYQADYSSCNTSPTEEHTLEAHSDDSRDVA